MIRPLCDQVAIEADGNDGFPPDVAKRIGHLGRLVTECVAALRRRARDEEALMAVHGAKSCRDCFGLLLPHSNNFGERAQIDILQPNVLSSKE